MTRTAFSVLALAAALAVTPASASILLDTGLQASVVAITASTDEHFSCDRYGCDQDYELYTMGASRFTLTSGGIANSITYAGTDGFVEIYRSGPGKLVKSPANLVWRNGASGQSSAVALGILPVGRHDEPIYEFTNSGLSIAMGPGTYWLTLWTPFPTFGHELGLLAGDGLSRNAASYGRLAVPKGWAYSTGPQASLQIDASGIYPGAVPEPASWALMIAGFGLVGGTLRRQRVQTAG